MEVRRLRPGDERIAVEAITSLKPAEERHDQEPGLEQMEKVLGKDDNYLIVALEEERPAGFLIAYKLDRIDRDKAMICFYEIGVSPEFRRRGVGRRLVEELKRIAGREKIMKIWVITNESNAAAMRLYESTGADRDPERDIALFVFKEIQNDEAGEPLERRRGWKKKT